MHKVGAAHQPVSAFQPVQKEWKTFRDLLISEMTPVDVFSSLSFPIDPHLVTWPELLTRTSGKGRVYLGSQMRS